MSFPKYEEYKDSGITWLGEVPSHWNCMKIKRCSYLKGRVGWKGLSSDEYLEHGYSYLVTGTDFCSRFIDWSSCHCIDKDRFEDDPFIQLQNDDLLITKDGTIGKLAIVSKLNKPACLNSGIFLLRPRHNTFITNYMYWVLSSQAFTLFCDLSSYGSTIQHLYQNVFERFVFPSPPLPEQSAIATFLDRETAKIDKLVSEQEKLIELLKEKRQTVISHAVTKGLNPDVPMKDSGIEWLGEVPKHWEVVRLKRVSPEITVGIVVEPSKYYSEQGVPALRSLNVQPGKIKDENLVYISDDANEQLKKSRLNEGDLVAVRSGQPGTTAVVPKEFDGANCIDLIIIRKPLADCEHYLSWFLSSDSALQQFAEGSGGAIQQHFNIGMAVNLLISRPPIQEQKEIVDHLKSETERLDKLIVTAQKAIDLLKERRSALISAAVTGKIDVRHLANTKEVA